MGDDNKVFDQMLALNLGQAYAASKAAAVALIDSLAADTKGTGVQVNSILPSTFMTLGCH
jgi:NAD(P)-dependent dehydrogenase (short-subunit alcohol dehydrogenase family)